MSNVLSTLSPVFTGNTDNNRLQPNDSIVNILLIIIMIIIIFYYYRYYYTVFFHYDEINFIISIGYDVVACLVLTDRVVFSDKDVGVCTTLSVNGRLFISPYEHLDALVSTVGRSLSLYIVNFFHCLIIIDCGYERIHCPKYVYETVKFDWELGFILVKYGT